MLDARAEEFIALLKAALAVPQLQQDVIDTLAAAQAAVTDAQAQAQAAETSSNAAQLKEWITEALRMTVDSYASEAEDVLVKIYTSNGDGTFAIADSADYSVAHWHAKVVAAAAAASGETQLDIWETQAWVMTANSYANEALNVPVKIYTSNGDGTFTAADTNPVEYSALHYKEIASTFGPEGYAALAGAVFTGAVSGIAPTLAAHFTRKDYVDTAITNAIAAVGSGWTVFYDGASQNLYYTPPIGRKSIAVVVWSETNLASDEQYTSVIAGDLRAAYDNSVIAQGSSADIYSGTTHYNAFAGYSGSNGNFYVSKVDYAGTFSTTTWYIKKVYIKHIQ